MNQKTIFAILGVVVVVLIGTTIYFATTKNVSQPATTTSDVVQQPSPTPAVQQPLQPAINQQPTAQPADKAASWQIYKNENLGSASFEVKYPAGYSIVLKTNNLVTIEKPKNCSGDDYCFPMKIEIKSLYNQGGLSIEDWFKEAGKQYIQTGTKTIAGKNSIMATPKETEGFGTRYVFGSGEILPNGTPQYIFDILVYSGVEDSVKDQILTTLKFTK